MTREDLIETYWVRIFCGTGEGDLREAAGIKKHFEELGKGYRCSIISSLNDSLRLKLANEACEGLEQITELIADLKR